MAFSILQRCSLCRAAQTFATQKAFPHREIWGVGEKKPMREASVFSVAPAGRRCSVPSGVSASAA
jgi:hypothetical protein